jgi:hypothetical protein
MPLASLYLSIMQAYGVNAGRFCSIDGTTLHGTNSLPELTRA